ncbi:MAG: TonB C-terminal domain-containing protein [Burkholderiales bacterium]|nr:TonB C-terminal domain-containing protein [Burkholderiales bacterium]
MTASVFGRRPDDRPPRDEDWSTGVTISIVAHATLIGALVWGLHWRSSTQPTESSAELWSAIPETAAPAPVETPPPPPPAPVPVPAPPPPVEAPKPPDIVTEQVKEQKKPPKPTPAPPPPKPAPPPPVPKPAQTPAQEKAELKKLHDENVKRMLAQMNGTAPPDSTGTGARNAGPSAGYAGRIIARLKPNLRLVDTIPGNPEAVVSIHCAPDGSIISRKLIKSSGSKAWDDAVLRAIDITNVLPRDTDGRIPDPIELTWHLQD